MAGIEELWQVDDVITILGENLAKLKKKKGALSTAHTRKGGS